MSIWYCKIGTLHEIDLPNGADWPMRKAIRQAFAGLTGQDDEFCFSGWSAELTECELAVVENREPVRELVANESPEMLRAALTAERGRANRAEADAVEAWRQVHLFKAEAGGPDGFATWKDAAIDERLRRVKAETERADRAEAELAVLRNNQLGPVSEGPLKALGAWIADHTDDDTWPAAERYLNAALAERDALRERMARLVGAIEKVQDIAGRDIRSLHGYAASLVQIIGVTRTALEGK